MHKLNAVMEDCRCSLCHAHRNNAPSYNNRSRNVHHLLSVHVAKHAVPFTQITHPAAAPLTSSSKIFCTMNVATVFDSSLPISIVRRHRGMISVESKKLMTSVSST